MVKTLFTTLLWQVRTCNEPFKKNYPSDFADFINFCSRMMKKIGCKYHFPFFNGPHSKKIKI